MGRATRRSMRTNSSAHSRAPASGASTRASVKPRPGACRMPQVSKASAAVKPNVPRQSRPAARGSRDSRSVGAAIASATAPTSALDRNTARQPSVSSSAPASTGPAARPTPKLVPSRLKARVRPWSG